MAEKKVLKVLLGSAYIDGKNVPVYADAWEQESKKGDKYFSLNFKIFVNKVNIPEKQETVGA